MKPGDLVELSSFDDPTIIHAEEIGYNNAHIRFDYFPPKTICLFLERFDQPHSSGFIKHKVLIGEKTYLVYEHTLKSL